MEEVQNKSSESSENLLQEVGSPQTESVTQELVLDKSSDQPAAQPDQQDSDWIKRLRKDRQEAINKSKMQDDIIKQLMANQQASPQSAQVEEDILQQIQREEYVPGNKVVRALQKQKEDFKRELEELRKETEHQKQMSLIASLKSEYEDFNDVVNPETLALLDETYPRQAQTIAKIKDPYDSLLMAYETIKSRGLTDKVSGSRRSKEVDKKLEQNKKTVQTPAAFEKRPMAQAFRMPETPEEREALHSEMMKFARLAGGY